MPQAVWVVPPVAIVLFVVVRGISSFLDRERARKLLFSDQVAERPNALGTNATGSGATVELWGSWIERWLAVSGFRERGALGRFLIAQGVCIAIGMVLTLVVSRSGMLEIGVEWLREIPGGVGDVLAPILAVAPWIIFILVGLLPVTRVRARRREIVQSVERDLPMTLALLATLVESGLGFDAAIERVLTSMDDRPLARDLRQFRSETRAGVPRAACFRALAERIDLVSMSTFVSAMVHAENVGGGIAESLRRQADEVWARRRELAVQKAQALPTKLSVPLVVCFLPGIFVHTFGPALAEFLRIAEGVISSSG